MKTTWNELKRIQNDQLKQYEAVLKPECFEKLTSIISGRTIPVQKPDFEFDIDQINGHVPRGVKIDMVLFTEIMPPIFATD